MTDEDRWQSNVEPSRSYTGESDIDIYEDEEVPTVVLVIIAVIAIVTASLYLVVAGGHNHFH